MKIIINHNKYAGFIPTRVYSVRGERDDEADAVGVYASSPDEAAETWAEWIDGEDGEVRPEQIAIVNLKEKGWRWRVKVTAETIVEYRGDAEEEKDSQ